MTTDSDQPSPSPSSGTVFTLANQLTLLRMLLIPAFVLLVVYGEFGWALVIFLVAGATDALDGLIARMSGQKSELGAWLDPAADKLLLVTTFIVLTLPNIGLVNRIPIWLTVIVISRDVGIVLTVAVVSLASGPRTFRPSQLGKAATAWFIVTCVVVMFYNWLGVTSLVVDFFIWTSLAVTLASGIDYVWRIGRALH
jgi:cardiolipin synthase